MWSVAATVPIPKTVTAMPAASPAAFGTSTTEASIRVRASQLDRLMDLLADLVSIRNGRETAINRVAQQQEELVRCATRLRRFNDQQIDHIRSIQNMQGDNKPSLGIEPTSANALAEIANDITEVARNLDDMIAPVNEENSALTQFIGLFRQELMQLRRLPVSGLFQRLKRAIRDAARAEDKKVEIHLTGGEIGVEQTVQEKLFDPLLHMVRNSVSHGIELPQARQKSGKSGHGNITLTAESTSSMLVLEIVDDGRGLDFDAIRRRDHHVDCRINQQHACS